MARIRFVALAAAWIRVWEPFPRITIIGIAATLIGGYPIIKEAWENIVERKMTMELSMTIALIAALAIGEFFTALVITAFAPRVHGVGHDYEGILNETVNPATGTLTVHTGIPLLI